MSTDSKVMLRGLFGLIALVAGMAGGFYAHAVTSSSALAVLVFLMTMYAVRRGLPDIIAAAERGKRIGFVGLPPYSGPSYKERRRRGQRLADLSNARELPARVAAGNDRALVREWLW